MATVEGVNAFLAQRLEKAKENLEDVEQNIRKLTGGDSTERRVSVGDSRRLIVGEQRRISGDQRRVSGDQRRLVSDQRRPLSDQRIERRLSGDQRRLSADQRGVSGDQRRVSMDAPGARGRGGGLIVQRLSLMERLGAPPAKRPNLGNPFSRLGGRVGPRNRAPSDDEEEDLDHKPLVQSSVVTTLTTLTPKTRQQTIKEGQKDKKSTDRNKRMFGHLLGTLQKFRDESDSKTDKDKRRKEIEKKLDEKAVEEKKAVAEERKLLMRDRKDKQAELNRLEQLVELTQEHKEWDAHSAVLSNYIRTRAKPSIFYKPAKWTLGTEKLFKESKQILSAAVEKRKAELEKEIAELEGKPTKEEEKKEEDEDSKKDRRRSGEDRRKSGEDRRRSVEERRRRHSNQDEVKGKKDDRDSSHVREDREKHGSDEKRRDRKRSRHEDDKEAKVSKPKDSAKIEEDQSSKDKEDESLKERTAETNPDHDEKKEKRKMMMVRWKVSMKKR
ncbi:pinin [Strongylocentrotus purpuratus]|uniref:Pinin n=1 Tax=Strongylocentrotus purpuratus TaxID=7668 RepID=A0A7M7PRW5_STRPU|nr:pinin [Strongylocentrotus purpuratus]